MANDFEALVQKAADLLKEPLRPLARPPRPDTRAQTVRIPMQGIAFPPDCPGCGKPAQRPFEVVFEDIGILFVIIAALSRRASPDTYRLGVPFCEGCADAIDRRRACIIGRLILLVIGMTLLQIPMAILRSFGYGDYRLHMLIHYASIIPVFGAIGVLIWWSVKVLRKAWYFGFRITGVAGDGLLVCIDDPGYAGRLQALCRKPAAPAAPPPAPR